MPQKQANQHATGLALARVLVVDDNPASRLTLQTVLAAGGYRVETAASAAEAFGKMDRDQYELVLSDLQMESPEAGLTVLAHARKKEYRPATALVTAYANSPETAPCEWSGRPILVEPEDVPELLDHVASLIGQRATRNVERSLGKLKSFNC